MKIIKCPKCVYRLNRSGVVLKKKDYHLFTGHIKKKDIMCDQCLATKYKLVSGETDNYIEYYDRDSVLDALRKIERRKK